MTHHIAVVLGFCNQTPNLPFPQTQFKWNRFLLNVRERIKGLQGHTSENFVSAWEMVMAGALLMPLSMCCAWGWLWWPSPQASAYGL